MMSLGCTASLHPFHARNPAVTFHHAGNKILGLKAWTLPRPLCLLPSPLTSPLVAFLWSVVSGVSSGHRLSQASSSPSCNVC